MPVAWPRPISLKRSPFNYGCFRKWTGGMVRSSASPAAIRFPCRPPGFSVPRLPLSPLWTIPGPDNFAFHLDSATVEFQTDFLLISGTGTLTGTGFDDTPAEWFFSTQGVAVDGKYSWSSTTTAIPEIGSTALFSAALLGACLLRRRNQSHPSPQNNDHENYISPRDVPDCLDGSDIGDPSRVH
jgi:hypothetical protein